jgi:hypothetical protein
MGSSTASPSAEDPFACFGDDDTSSSTADGSDKGNNDDSLSDTATLLKNSETARKLMEQYHNNEEKPQKRVLPISSPNDFEIFDVPITGGGYMKGIRATRSFRCGEEIMRESAILRLPNTQSGRTIQEADLKHKNAVRRSFHQLHHDTQDAMMELSSCVETEETKTPLGIYDTNSFRLTAQGDDDDFDEDDGPCCSGLFLTVARINHSCRPTANHFWRPDLRQMLVFAARDIAVGEEISTMYGPSESLSTAGRREYLYDRFSFHCMCMMCEEANETGGDDRMMEIHSLQEEIDLLAVTGECHLALTAIQRCLQLMKCQGIGSGVFTKPLLRYGYEMSIRIKDLAGSQRYLSEELLAIQQSEGADSRRALCIMEHVNAIESYR